MHNNETVLERCAEGALPGEFSQAGEVRLVHWWVSGGETAALEVLRRELAVQGVVFSDTAIAGGDSMLTALKGMVAAGERPTAAVMTGYSTWEWARRGVLGDLSDLAEEEDWATAIPQVLQTFCKYEDRWIGVPVAMHSVNWVWINRAAAEKIGLSKPPATLEDLFSALERARMAGLVPMAIGGQAWLIATLFDSVVVATNGLDFYRKAFLDLDSETLTSPGMTQAFSTLRRLAGYTDAGYRERTWSDATGMVVAGEALLEVSGDWAKAEYRTARKDPDTDYICARFPGTEDCVLFNADLLALFGVDPDHEAAQRMLARAVMAPGFQLIFNDAKGAAPVRIDVPDSGFDAFGRQAIADIKAANEKSTLVGSMAHGYVQPAAIQDAYFRVVMRVFQGELAPEAAGGVLAAAFTTEP